MPFPRPGIELISADHQLDPPFVTNDVVGIQLSQPGINSIPSIADIYTTAVEPVAVYLESLVSNLSVPQSWRLEGIEMPTQDCRTYAGFLLRRLFDSYGLIPYKTSISKEGGVFAAYRGNHNNNILRVELDNDLDAVAVVSDGVSILDSAILDADDNERALVAIFNRHSASDAA